MVICGCQPAFCHKEACAIQYTTEDSIGPGRLEASEVLAPRGGPCPSCGHTQPHVSIRVEEGQCRLTLCGHFELTWEVGGQVALRLLILFLRSLRTVTSTPMRPFLRQEWLATCFQTHQEQISRWERYWREKLWHALLSEHLPLVLTEGMRDEVLTEWVANFWLTAPQIQARLVARGLRISRRLIETAARESGFARVRGLLRELAPLRETGFQLPDDWHTQRLFALVDELQGRLQRGESLPRQTVIEIQGLRQATGAAGPPKPRLVQPWQAHIDQWLTGTWEGGAEEEVVCPHCHGNRVGQKSGQPRYKTYWGADGQKHQVAVYRWYCRNEQCPFKSFTAFPAGLLPHTPFGLVTRFFVLGVYLGYRTSYRRAGWAVGLAGSTVYRWVHFWAQHPALFAVLTWQGRTSGVVAVDEKWVKVRPAKPTKPHPHAVWMYVYLAVDVYTYQILHMALSPVNDANAARLFLLELRAKGYMPTVIVTDLRQDYGKAIHAVFPQAVHHECVFHALQNAQRQVREAYGPDYRHIPAAVALKHAIYRIFQAKTQKTARQRFHQVMACREAYVAETPDTAAIFDSLERHFPRLVNALESELIPLTNNAVELVIRRFNQHYRNFGGFDSEDTCRNFLLVFQLAHGLTPFAQDDRQVASRGYSIRGKSPLELAGYDLGRSPLAHLFRDPLLTLPGQPELATVPMR
jgi:transposase-like protein